MTDVKDLPEEGNCESKQNRKQKAQSNELDKLINQREGVAYPRSYTCSLWKDFSISLQI